MGYATDLCHCADLSEAKTTELRLSLLPVRRLSIHVTNPQYGVSKSTGEVSADYILAERIIASSTILQDLRALSTTFRDIMSGDDTTKLDEWISEHEKGAYRKIAAFVKGLKRDIEAVKNAIVYSWSNGLVEGMVNKVKTIKRALYGRAKIELLRRKVCLSQVL